MSEKEASLEARRELEGSLERASVGLSRTRRSPIKMPISRIVRSKLKNHPVIPLVCRV